MVSRRRRIPLLTTALCSLLAAGCAALGPPIDPYAIERNALVVQNRGWEDVTIFVVRGDAAIRIGVVQGLSSRVFVLPSAITGSGLTLQLRGERRITDQAFTSHVFNVQPGEMASWTIEALPSLSHVIVR
jgi:hypothetical protein